MSTVTEIDGTKYINRLEFDRSGSDIYLYFIKYKLKQDRSEITNMARRIGKKITWTIEQDTTASIEYETRHGSVAATRTAYSDYTERNWPFHSLTEAASDELRLFGVRV